MRQTAWPDSGRRTVIVGAGIAGLVAAIRAAEKGARVVVLEKLDDKYWVDPLSYTSHTLLEPVAPGEAPPQFVYGDGNETLHSGGNFHPMTAALDEFRYESWGLGNVALFEALKPVSRDVFDALKRWGVDLGQRTRIAPDGRRWRGRHLCWALLNQARSLGVEVRFRTSARELVRGPDDSGVAGVVAAGPGGQETLSADSVILATGGLEGSEAKKRQYWQPNPQMAEAPVTGCPTNVGDGLDLAQPFGARLNGMSASHLRTPDAVIFAHGPTRALGGMYQQCLLVNGDGNRFADENGTSDILANSIVRQHGFIAYLIWDGALAAEYRDLIERYVAETVDEAVVPVSRERFIASAPDVDGLGKALGLQPGVLENTVARFNAAVRADGSAAGIPAPKARNARRLETPPYYAHPVTCAVNHGLGGLVTDDRMRVLATTGSAVPGLYACGSLVWLHYGQAESSHGASEYRSSYPLAAGLTASACMGYIAGEQAALTAKARLASG